MSYLTKIVAAETLTTRKLQGAATAANNVGDKLHTIALSLLEHARLTGNTAQLKVLLSGMTARSCHTKPLKAWVQLHSPIRILEQDGVIVKMLCPDRDTFEWNLDLASENPHYHKQASTKKEFTLEKLVDYVALKGNAEKAAKNVVTEEAQLAASILAEIMNGQAFKDTLAAKIEAAMLAS
jgi:hypothetical protein